MNRHDRGIVVGMCLGDGHIRTATSADKLAGRRIAAQLTFSHSIKQHEYALWKVARLNAIFGGKATLRTGDHKAGKICYAAKSNPYFKTLKGMLYENGVKRFTRQVLDMLNDEGIAIWHMDDGSQRLNRRSDGTVSSASMTLSTYCSREEVDVIITFFLETRDIEFRPAYCKKTQKWYVRTNTLNARKYAETIGKYMVPSMLYKLSGVQLLSSQERHAPDKVCKSCDKQFAALKALGLCMNCYNTQYFKSLEAKEKICCICGHTTNAKWFVGDRCRACYQRAMR